jgi:hypothetical protein
MTKTKRQRVPGGGSAKVAAALAALLVALVVGGCPPTPPPVPPAPPLPPELDFPAAYRVQGSGTVAIDDITLPSTLRMDYLVYPSGRVVVSHLEAWIGDLDIVVKFLWWETDRERLRCNQISNVDPIVGRLTGDRIDFATGSSSFEGLSFDQRDSTGECPGLARQVAVTNDGPFSLIHDPAGDRSELTASFSATYDGNTVPLAFRLTGRFLNRPPVAAIGVAPPGTPWQMITEGCPTGPQGESLIPPNHPDGLVLDLRSFSYDVDSRASERFNQKFPRGDISTEQWGHATGGKYAYLGEGRLLGPVLFGSGMRHALLLTVTDRTGAKARQLCVFEVSAP